MPPPNPVARQCIGINYTKKRGIRCKRKTGKTPYCYQHLKIIKNLQIKKSKVPNSGKGVFTTAAIKRNQNIVPYGGLLINGDAKNPRVKSDYILELTGDKYIDADPKRCITGIGGLCNMCKRSDVRNGYCPGNNANFHITKKNGRITGAMVKSTKPIKRGEEIFANYGPEYFKTVKQPKKKVVIHAPVVRSKGVKVSA
jgi:hypothetical protein